MSENPQADKKKNDAEFEQNKNDDHEKSIILIGSRESGKTTMIYRFLEKEDSPKPTLAIDYSYGRKAGKSLIKDIVHVWEVGQLEETLVTSAIKGSSLTHSPRHITVVIMLDLSKPETLWYTLDKSLKILEASIKNAGIKHEVLNQLRQVKLKECQSSKDGESELKDKSSLFPLILCIIGGKYDLFKDFDSDRREFVGQMLRAVAFVLGASLYYHTAKDAQILRKSKDLLSHYAFKGQPTKASCTDYSKPLAIPWGTDTLASINLSRDVKTLNPETIKQIYGSRIPQDAPEEKTNFEDPSSDPNFAEPIIDRLRGQREQETDILLRDMMEGKETKILIPDPY